MTSGQLPLKRVVVYRNGVGYFERGGRVDEQQVSFRMRQKTVGDFLATLAIVERGGSTVRSASFPIEVKDKYQPQPEPVCPKADERCVPPKPPEPKEKNPLRDVVLSLDGEEHDLLVGYVAETPLWRPSYRVVVGKGDQAELQSWGIVQNLSGEDWSNVQLVLVAGAPLAFRSTLGEPITPPRPTVTDSGEVIAAVPEGVTSLKDESGGEVERYVPEEAPAADASADMEEMAEGSGAGAAPGAPAKSAKARVRSYSAAKPTSSPRAEAMEIQAAPVMAPAPLTGLPPSAPRNIGTLAGVAVESGATRYTLPYPITVPDESATMVLLSSRAVPGQAVFLFAPDGGVPDSASHPFRVARFTNATEGLLERGPIAVFEQGSFLGQGMLDSLPPGATATVPFALERGIGVESHVARDERGARLFKVESGNLTIERDQVIRTTYAMKNGTDEQAKLLVRHPRLPGTRLFKPPPGTEDNTGEGNALLPMTIKPHGRAELVVDEREPRQESVDWLSPLADEAVKAYLADSRSDRAAVAQLTQAWKIRQAWKQLTDERNKLTTEQGELEHNADQIRQSLRAIEKNKQAASLREKLTGKLGDLMVRLDKISKRLVETELSLREQEVRFRDAILELKILKVPPARD